MAFDQVHALMAEIGGVLGLAEVMAFPDDQLWTLALDDGQVVEAELDGHERLLLSTEAGEVGAGEKLRTLLEFNLLWHATGGLRFALAGTQAVLMVDHPAGRLDLPTLAALLTGLHTQAQHWRRALAAPADGQAGSPGDGWPGGAIRV